MANFKLGERQQALALSELTDVVAGHTTTVGGLDTTVGGLVTTVGGLVTTVGGLTALPEIPAEGTHTLKSVAGVLTWVEDQ